MIGIRIRVLLSRMSYLVVLLIVLTIGACATINRSADGLSDVQKEALLKERATEMWKAQTANDRAKMYELYDSFFRARVKKGTFADKEVAYIKYYNPEVLDVDIKGNVATVRVKMEYEIKGLMGTRGEKIDQPKKENITHETWLFIDGNWNRQFIDYMTESSIVQY